MFGTSGNDKMAGGSGNDVFSSLAGNDRLIGNAGDDRLYGGSGIDTLGGGDGNDRLDGGTGKDILWGGAGNDALYGGAGEDSLYADSGNDRLFGGDGQDFILYGAGVDTVFGGNGIDVIYNNAAYTDATIYGGAGDDDISGPHVFGGAGNDFVEGDFVYGGNSNDNISAQNHLDGITAAFAFGGAGDDSIDAHQILTLSNSEYVTLGEIAVMNGGTGFDVMTGEMSTEDWFVYRPGDVAVTEEVYNFEPWDHDRIEIFASGAPLSFAGAGAIAGENQVVYEKTDVGTMIHVNDAGTNYNLVIWAQSLDITVDDFIFA